jgi:hypothetical protein
LRALTDMLTRRLSRRAEMLTPSFCAKWAGSHRSSRQEDAGDLS